MLIRKRLQLSAGIICILLVLLLAFSLLEIHEERIADRKDDLAGAILRNIYERTFLRDEFLVHHADRAYIQWTAKTEELRVLLETAPSIFTTPHEQSLINRLRGNFDATVTLFGDLRRSLAQRTGGGIVSEREKLLYSQLVLKSYLMHEDIGRLRHLNRGSPENAHKRLQAMIVLFFFSAAFIVLGNSLIIHRILAKGIAVLHRGLTLIGSGNLDYRIPVEGNDEFTRLAATCNTMAEQLQQSLTSVDRLTVEVAKRSLLEQSLRQNEALKQAILDSVASNIAVLDRHGTIITVNEQWRVFARENSAQPGNVPPNTEPGTNYLAICRASTGESSEGAIDACNGISAVLNGKLTTFTMEYPCHSPEHQRWFMMTSTPLGTPAGGAVVTHFDISGRKLAEEERERLINQLHQAQKMEVVGRLAGGVAHDFNNALAIIFLSIELLKMDLPDHAAAREPLRDLETAATRARDVTRQLLAFSRKQMVSARPLDLNLLIRNLQKSLGRLVGEDIIMQTDLQAIPSMILIDPTQADQVIINLVINARDAMPHGGALSMETSLRTLSAHDCLAIPDASPGEYVQLTVRDTGSGIDPEVLPHIFEPFFTTKDIGQGTGLGLASIYGIVRQNRGFVEVESTFGHGATFRICFPLLARVEKSSPMSVRDEPVRGSGSILLVEDDELLCKATKISLELLGYTVDAVCSPEEALRFIKEKSRAYSLLLTDVVMPGMSGCELQMKIAESVPDIRTLFISGYPDGEQTCSKSTTGLTAWIQKPFSIPDLSRAVREMLDRQPQ